jgi:hypothetical protein
MHPTIRNSFIALSLSILAMAYTGCKDDDKQFNTLKITSGEFSGFAHTFAPNLGFWSPVDENTRYVHLVLGDDENLAQGGENVMSIVFYYTGSPQVPFPSPEGQWIEFGLNIDGVVYSFEDEDAVLTIYQMDDYYFEGTLSGEFRDLSSGSTFITFTLDISMDMQEI